MRGSIKTICPIIILLLQTLVGCGSQAKVWKGKYITFKTTETPKEDFKVGPYIVISYAPIEYMENPYECYKFAIIKEGVQTNLLVLRYDMEIAREFGFKQYYLLMEEGGIITIKDTLNKYTGQRTTGAYREYGIYKAFDELPSYKELKNLVIGLLKANKLRKIY